MSSGQKHFYEFGPFRIDTVERQLLCGDEPVQLTPKAYETLLALAENAGRALDKDELLRRVWPDTFVEEGSLTRNISVLRKALGDFARPSLMRMGTISKLFPSGGIGLSPRSRNCGFQAKPW